MIGRRAFMLGLAPALMAGAASGEVRVNGRITNDQEYRRLKERPYVPLEEVPNHRALMRDIVHQLAGFCHQRTPRLSVVIRNGAELIVKGQREWEWQKWRDPAGAKAGKYSGLGSIDHAFLQDIDGVLFDGMIVGKEIFGKATVPADRSLLLQAARAAMAEGKMVFDVEYGPDKDQLQAIADMAKREKIATMINQSADGPLAVVPKGLPARENPDHIEEISKARNFLLMTANDGYQSKADWLEALAQTNYDILMIDAFWRDAEPVTFADIKSLKMKRLGTRRQVLNIMPVGRAREGAYYWTPGWKGGNPPWLAVKDPNDPSRWVVEYWSDGWKAIMAKHIEAAAKAGFDGVLLDYADGYLPFEDMIPID